MKKIPAAWKIIFLALETKIYNTVERTISCYPEYLVLFQQLGLYCNFFLHCWPTFNESLELDLIYKETISRKKAAWFKLTLKIAKLRKGNVIVSNLVTSWSAVEFVLFS